MHNQTAFVLTVLVFCYAAVSGLVRRWYLAPGLIFVVLGGYIDKQRDGTP